MLALAALVWVSYKMFQHVAAVFLAAATDTIPAPHKHSKDIMRHICTNKHKTNNINIES